MPGKDASDSRDRSFLARAGTGQFLYPTGATFAIFFILFIVEQDATGSPNRLFNLFQALSVSFFVVLLFRLLLRPGQERLQAADHSRSIEGSLFLQGGMWIAVAAGAVSYLRTLSINFLCDDYGHLELVRHPFSAAVLPEFTKGQGGVFYRPLAFVSLFLDHRVWRHWVPGYHLTSVLIHLGSVAGVVYLCKQLELKSRICFAAALFFAVMPVNVQTVTWMAARFDQLAGLFAIWSIACAAKFRRTGQARWYSTAIVLFVPAVLSKENAYVVAVLWAALELLPRRKDLARPSAAKRAAIAAGYLAAPVIMMVLRISLLGGIGGYRTGDAPMALHFPVASVFGLLVRAPGEMLFGWDWLAAGSQRWIVAAILTAAIFLMLALRMKTSSNSRRLIMFALIWIFIAAAPAHFYFWAPDPGLFVSRTLYFGAMGLAILIAVLLDETFSQPRMYQAWAALIGLLLFAGTQSNISAWQSAAGEAQTWLAEFKREHPSPPAGVTYYIKGVPDQDRGVPFFAAGLESAVRSKYSWREDIHVVTDRSSTIPDDAIVIKYD